MDKLHQTSFDAVIDDRKDTYNQEEFPNVKMDTIRTNASLSDEYTSFPKKTLITSIILFIIGSILLIAGFIEELISKQKSNGLALLIVGSIAFIPGLYYSFLFLKVYRAKTHSEKMQILREIPDM